MLALSAGNAASREVATRIEVPGGASGIAFGAGALWVTLMTGKLARIDADKRTVTLIRTGKRPTGVIVGNGSVWVAGAEDGNVLRIDPATNSISATIEVGGDIDKLGMVGNEVWAVVDRGIVRIDPATNHRIGVPLLPDDQPYAFIVGFDSVWVSCVGKNEVVRIDLPTKKVVARISVGLAPGGLATLDGAIWVANRKDDTLSRIDPATNKVVAKREAGARPTAIATSAGLLWVTCLQDNVVAVLSSTSKQPVRTIPVGNRPAEIVAGNGALWVAHLADAFVTRIDPSVTDRR